MLHITPPKQNNSDLTKRKIKTKNIKNTFFAIIWCSYNGCNQKFKKYMNLPLLSDLSFLSPGSSVCYCVQKCLFGHIHLLCGCVRQRNCQNEIHYRVRLPKHQNPF